MKTGLRQGLAEEHIIKSCSTCASKCTQNQWLLRKAEKLKTQFAECRILLRNGDLIGAGAKKEEAQNYAIENIIVPITRSRGESKAFEEAASIIDHIIEHDFGFDEKFVEYINSE